MTAYEAIELIGSMCVRMFGLLVIIAENVSDAPQQREFIGKQREWIVAQQNLLELERMVDEAIGGKE